MDSICFNQPLISIIVPVYNVEKYLKKCVESILVQDYGNIEILLIDDGSEDDSGKICDEYQQRVSFIKTIHKKNGGLSSARNAGIDAAIGDYYVFIDSDDMIEEGYISYLYDLLIKHDADMAVCDLFITSDQNKRREDIANVEKEFDAKEAIRNSLYQKDIDVSACAKLYKSCLFDIIRFPEGQDFEDLATTYKLYDLCRKVVYGNRKYYIYFRREGSITKGIFSEKNFEVLLRLQELEKYVLARYPDLKYACYRRRNIITAHIIIRAYECGCEKNIRISELKKSLWKTYKYTLIDKEANVKDKVKLLLISFNPCLFLRMIK